MKVHANIISGGSIQFTLEMNGASEPIQLFKVQKVSQGSLNIVESDTILTKFSKLISNEELDSMNHSLDIDRRRQLGKK